MASGSGLPGCFPFAVDDLQEYPGGGSEDEYEDRLERVDDEGERGCLGFRDAVHAQQGDDDEVPGACAVGGGDDDGHADGGEDDGSCPAAERLGEREGVEAEVELQVVARPDGHGVEDEEPEAAYVLQRHEALHEVVECLGHAAHGLVLAAVHEPPRHHQHGHDGCGEDVEPRVAQHLHQAALARARLVEEAVQLVELQHEHQAAEREGEEEIDDAFGHERAERLAEGHAVVLGQHAAARHLADARHDDVRGVGHVDGEYAVDGARAVADGLQRLQPAGTAQDVADEDGDERDEEPSDARLLREDDPRPAEVEIAVHVIEDAGCDEQRYQPFGSVLEGGLHTFFSYTKANRVCDATKADRLP